MINTRSLKILRFTRPARLVTHVTSFLLSVQEEKYTCGGKIKRQSRDFGSQEHRNWIRKEGFTVSELSNHQLNHSVINRYLTSTIQPFCV